MTLKYLRMILISFYLLLSLKYRSNFIIVQTTEVKIKLPTFLTLTSVIFSESRGPDIYIKMKNHALVVKNDPAKSYSFNSIRDNISQNQSYSDLARRPDEIVLVKVLDDHPEYHDRETCPKLL